MNPGAIFPTLEPTMGFASVDSGLAAGVGVRDDSSVGCTTGVGVRGGSSVGEPADVGVRDSTLVEDTVGVGVRGGSSVGEPAEVGVRDGSSVGEPAEVGVAAVARSGQYLSREHSRRRRLGRLLGRDFGVCWRDWCGCGWNDLGPLATRGCDSRDSKDDRSCQQNS